MRRPRGTGLALGAAMIVAVAGTGMASSGTPSRSVGHVSQSVQCHTWVTGKLPTDADTSSLWAISAISPTNIWAAGGNDGDGILVDHFDGRTWSISLQNFQPAWGLSAVAAIASDDVWAIGFRGQQDLIEHWNGTSWTQVFAPDPSDYDLLFASVALGPDDVWAGGDYRYSDGSLQPLWLHWDGMSWTQVTQVVLPEGGIISAMSAVSPTDIWAAGYQGDPAGNLAPLLEHWDGTSWTSVKPAPTDLGGEDLFTAIHAISTDDVWVVGSHEVHRSLVQHWDGTAWSNVQAPYGGVMNGVWGAASDDVWAVGRAGQIGHFQPTTEHWDGAAWTMVQTPRSGVQSIPNAITGTSASNLWAVGYLNNPDTAPFSMHSHGLCG